VIALLLVAAILLPPVVGAQASYPSWWGDRDMNAGWHLRIPVLARNNLSVAMHDAAVREDLDLRSLLGAAGWPASAQGATSLLHEFDFDEASVRVVEYRSLGTGASTDGLIVGEVPSRATPGMLAGNAPYDRALTPAFHVDWVMPGATKAGQTRAFMIYLDTKQNGQKPAADYTPAQVAPLDAAYWITKGTHLVGTAGKVGIFAIDDGTSALVQAYQFGHPTPIETAPDSPVHNPLSLNASDFRELDVSSDPALIEVTSNKPVIAVAMDGLLSGPVPSLDGSTLGTQFRLPPAESNGFWVYAPQGTATLSIDGSTTTLTPGAPLTSIPATTPPQQHVVSSDAPVLVLAIPQWSTFAQWPALDGAPVGPRLVGPLYQAQAHSGATRTNQPPCEPGIHRVTERGAVLSIGGDGYARGRDALTGDARQPLDATGRVDPSAALASPTTPWLVRDDGAPCPLVVYATPSASESTLDERATLASFTATIPSSAGHGAAITAVGGVGGTSFSTLTSQTVVGLYDATRVHVAGGGLSATDASLGANDLTNVAWPESGAATIHATKPVVLVPSLPGGFFAGLDDSITPWVQGPLQYRGYLVSLKPGGGLAEPLVGSTGPGTPIVYPLIVQNLAKDSGGNGVPDTIHLAVTPLPAGWSAVFSDTDVRLAGGASRAVTLTVTPPADAHEGERAVVELSAASAGNPDMVDRMRATTIVRATRAVDAWFDGEGGPKAKNVAYGKGENKTLTLVVKNTATIPDDIIVRALPGSPEWGATFADGTRIASLHLDPDQTATLPVLTSAPAGGGSATQLELVAESAHDASAAAQVTATLRALADLHIELDANASIVQAQPGESAHFNVTFHNRGDARMGIDINVSGSYEGWGAPTVSARGYNITELLGIPPRSDVTLDLAIPVPADAARAARANLRLSVQTIPQFLGDPVATDALDLVAVAGAIHGLAFQDPSASASVNGHGVASARLALLNGGNGVENVTLVPEQIPRGFGLVMGPPASIPVGQQGQLGVDLQVPSDAPPGPALATFLVQSDDGATVPWSLSVEVPERAALNLTALTPLRATAGLPSLLSVDVENVGNTRLDLSALQIPAPEGWTVAARAEPASLGPGEHALLKVNVTPDAKTDLRAWSLAPAARFASATPLQVAVQRVQLSITTRLEGGAVRATVANAGDADADEVQVVLTRDATVLDRATLHRVRAGGASDAVLALAGPGSYAVSVEAQGPLHAEPAAFEVSPEHRAPDVSVATLCGIGLVAALAFGRRARR
jgi:uncharacterized membrane protein